MLLADRHSNLRHQPPDTDFLDSAHQLIAPANMSEKIDALRYGPATGTVQVPVNFALGNAVMPPGRLNDMAGG